MNGRALEVAGCEYCGQMHQIEVEGKITQSELKEMATNQCSCVKATEERKRKTRKENIENDISELFSEFEDSRMLLMAAVIPIMRGSIDSITIDTGKKVKGKISITSKGNIKVERIATQKVASES